MWRVQIARRRAAALRAVASGALGVVGPGRARRSRAGRRRRRARAAAGGAGATRSATRRSTCATACSTVKRTLVPIRRVQHVDTETGPVQGMFDLATVSFHTAAGEHRDPGADPRRGRGGAARASPSWRARAMTSEAPGGRRLHIAAVGAEALDGAAPAGAPADRRRRSSAAAGSAASWSTARSASLISVGYAWVQWTSTRWYLDGETVRLRRGIISEQVVTVPLDRVQAIDTVRGPVQRLFGVVELHVQSAGGGARRRRSCLKAVEPADGRGAARGGPRRPRRRRWPPCPWHPRDQAPGRAGVALGRGRLLVAALTSGSLGVLVPVVAAASQVARRRARRRGRRAPAARHGARVDPARARGAARRVGAVGARDDRRVRRLPRGARRRAAAHRARDHRAARGVGAGRPRRTRCGSSRARCASRSASRRCGSRPRATRASAPRRRRSCRSCAATRSPRCSASCCPSSTSPSTASSRCRAARAAPLRRCRRSPRRCSRPA